MWNINHFDQKAMILPRVVTRLCVRGPGGDHQAVQGVALRLLLHGTPGELGLVDSWALSSDWWTHGAYL